MKLLIALFVLMSATASFATVDMQTQIYIVAERLYDGEPYEVIQAPAEFCVGIPSLALAQALTKPVIISKGYACGGEGVVENTNVLTCAKIEAEEVFKGEKYVPNQVRVSVDLSGCGERKNDKLFQDAVNQAIAKTYKAHKIKIVK